MTGLRDFWRLLEATARLARSDPRSLFDATAAHLNLVAEALALAVLIGVPLGIVSTRSRSWERAAVGAANVLQTIPSLALLGFLLAVFGGAIGKPPALTALVLYALLPIIKNTILGLRGVDRGVAEAALGMGMTRWQRLTLVELPLAVPVILGGIRVAAVATVGLATIAAYIGARGLGSYIQRGLSLSDLRLILLGSIPAALLALACDAALGEVEHALDPRRGRRSALRMALALSGTLALAGIALWGGLPERSGAGGGRPIVIGTKGAGESILLGQMLAELVEAHTALRVDRPLKQGEGGLFYDALRRGGLDAYVEYTGTALTTILKEPPDHDPDRVLARVREVMAARDGVACLDPLGFENTFAILMRRRDADRLGIRRISDLRAHQDELKAGFGYEFMGRPDGYPGLVRAYGLELARRPVEMERGLLYEALARGSIDVAAGDSTDGRIVTLDFVQLEDDRRYFPPYQAVPLVRMGAIRAHPELGRALNMLAGRLDSDTMRRLNRQVDQEKRDPAEVAREYLRSIGLVPG